MTSSASNVSVTSKRGNPRSYFSSSSQCLIQFSSIFFPSTMQYAGLFITTFLYSIAISFFPIFLVFLENFHFTMIPFQKYIDSSFAQIVKLLGLLYSSMIIWCSLFVSERKSCIMLADNQSISSIPML